MKKAIRLTMVSLILIGSSQGFAETEDDISIMINQGKIEAAMRAQEDSSVDIDNMDEGKIEATMLMNTKIMLEESDQNADRIRVLSDKIAETMDDSQGLLHALGQYESQATFTASEMKKIAKKMDNMRGDSLFEAYNKVSELNSEVRELAKEAATLAK